MRKFVSLAVILCGIMFFAGCNTVRDAVGNIMTGDYVVGTIDGNEFFSEWLNLRFTAPSGFIMATQEEMWEFTQLGMEVADIDPAIANWAEMAVAFEMMAMTLDGMVSVTVLTERVMLRAMTVEQYFEAMLQGVRDSLGWIVDFNYDMEPVNFAGLEWYTATSTVQAFGMDFTYRYFVRRFDNRMAVITIYAITGQEAQIDILVNAFRAY